MADGVGGVKKALGEWTLRMWGVNNFLLPVAGWFPCVLAPDRRYGARPVVHGQFVLMLRPSESAKDLGSGVGVWRRPDYSRRAGSNIAGWSRRQITYGGGGPGNDAGTRRPADVNNGANEGIVTDDPSHLAVAERENAERQRQLESS